MVRPINETLQAPPGGGACGHETLLDTETSPDLPRQRSRIDIKFTVSKSSIHCYNIYSVLRASSAFDEYEKVEGEKDKTDKGDIERTDAEGSEEAGT